MSNAATVRKITLRGTYLDQETSKKLLEFMGSEEDADCGVPHQERWRRMERNKEENGGAFLTGEKEILPELFVIKDKYEDPARPYDSVSYRDLISCLSIADITLKDLLEKCGIVLRPNTATEELLLNLLGGIPEGDRRLVEFNNEMSHMVSDYWFDAELQEMPPFDRFRDFRYRMFSRGSGRTQVDKEINSKVDGYPTFLAVSYYYMHKSLPIMVVAANVVDAPIRWLFGLGQEDFAFTRHREADLALEQYTKLGPQGRRIYTMVFNTVFPEVGTLREVDT